MKREVIIRVNGKEYTLRLGNNALCRFEAETGITAIKLAALGPDEMEQRFMRALLWAGLKKHHPDMTLDMAGDLIDDIGLDQTGEYIRDALSAAHPPPVPGENPRQAVRHGNGNGS